MASQFELLAAEALKLSEDEREDFVQLLSASLEQGAAGESVLAAEAERRAAELESGATQAIPIHDAIALVRAGLK